MDYEAISDSPKREATSPGKHNGNTKNTMRDVNKMISVKVDECEGIKQISMTTASTCVMTLSKIGKYTVGGAEA